MLCMKYFIFFFSFPFLLMQCQNKELSVDRSTLKQDTGSLQQPCEKDKDISSIGEPSSIVLPSTAEKLFASNAPTYFELNGVNVNMGNQWHFSEMKDLNQVFSHARTFHFMNKDYWDDGLGQANGNDPKTLRKYDPKDIDHLKLLVDSQGIPLLRNEWKAGDKMIWFDPVQEILVEEKLEPGFFNVYENYMNQNWIYQKQVSDQFNGNLQTTLTVVNINFPKQEQSKYNFPNQWFLDEDWGDVRLSAKAYAMLFARAYAPKDESYQVCKVLEIGNEPWGLKAETYQKIIAGFVEGFNAYYGGTWRIKLLPAAFQGQHNENKKPANWERANWKDYFGTRLNTSARCDLAGINIHNYSNDLNDRPFSGWFKERLIATPEQSSSAFLFARNAWKWSRDNMPESGREIYASEYGWDTNDNCMENVNATAVGEVAQGVYTCRALLVMSRMGINRANVFELLDDEAQNPCQFAYHSSGFYTRVEGKIRAKKSITILADFIRNFGHLRFKQVLHEGEDFYLYELTDGSINYRVGWLPFNVNNYTLKEIQTIQKEVQFNKQKINLSPMPALIE